MTKIIFAMVLASVFCAKAQAASCNFPQGSLSAGEYEQLKTICTNGLNSLITSFKSKDPCAPSQGLLGQKCTNGCTVCVAGKSVFKAIYDGTVGAFKKTIEDALAGGPNASAIPGIQNTIVSAAFEMFSNTQVVQGITYIGGYSISCEGYGGSLNVNDKMYQAFSREVSSTSTMCTATSQIPDCPPSDSCAGTATRAKVWQTMTDGSPVMQEYCGAPANKGKDVTLTRKEKCTDAKGDHILEKCTPARCM